MPLTDQELFQRIRSVMSGTLDVIPDGFRTSAQWSKVWGISARSARELLLGGERSDVMQRRKFRIFQGNGVREVAHWGQK